MAILYPTSKVIQLFAEGHSIKRIADILNILTRTVEFHKYSIIESLNLKSAADFMRYAIKQEI